jgi:hypothetical protein
MNNFQLPANFLPWFLVLLVVQYGLQIWALIDLVNHDNIHGKKWAWVLVIVLGETLGPIIYLLFGKKK